MFTIWNGKISRINAISFDDLTLISISFPSVSYIFYFSRLTEVNYSQPLKREIPSSIRTPAAAWDVSSEKLSFIDTQLLTSNKFTYIEEERNIPLHRINITN